ncbi:hypothetical protein BDY19DRAFT_334806 [Irpex rosettiformis]|uniref:Uncharacterized protein n=1 Tax=Irpex rosettiformis TaxID=378272 RepID=A0ACB8TYG9_9APHY|nr:hypothetical protein BDY19DRAFT_334806 [Irpex rosettiformis]
MFLLVHKQGCNSRQLLWTAKHLEILYYEESSLSDEPQVVWPRRANLGMTLRSYPITACPASFQLGLYTHKMHTKYIICNCGVHANIARPSESNERRAPSTPPDTLNGRVTSPLLMSADTAACRSLFLSLCHQNEATQARRCTFLSPVDSSIQSLSNVANSGEVMRDFHLWNPVAHCHTN